jgi:hypothetical protein
MAEDWVDIWNPERLYLMDGRLFLLVPGADVWAFLC